MENNDDKILRDFFGKGKIEIENDGFSTQVLRKLPEKKQKTGWIVPLFAMIGVVVSFLLVDIREALTGLFSALLNVPLLYMLGGIVLFPIVFLFFYLYWERRTAY